MGRGPLADLLVHRNLLKTLIRRDVTTRYQGSSFGLLWAFATPLLMFCAYWFFLGVVMSARWGGTDARHFPLMLFAGLLVHQFVAEVLNRASSLIIGHATYVSKVVFPIQVLSWMTVATAVFNLMVYCLILLLGQLAMLGSAPLTWLWVPVVMLPLLPMLAGFSWLLSSLGVYLRDIEQVVPLAVTMLMFLSPIFYPAEMVPERFRFLIWINPLTSVIEQLRRVTIIGLPPDIRQLALFTAASLVVMAAGYWWFERTRKGFADVL